MNRRLEISLSFSLTETFLKLSVCLVQWWIDATRATTDATEHRVKRKHTHTQRLRVGMFSYNRNLTYEFACVALIIDLQ